MQLSLENSFLALAFLPLSDVCLQRCIHAFPVAPVIIERVLYDFQQQLPGVDAAVADGAAAVVCVGGRRRGGLARMRQRSGWGASWSQHCGRTGRGGCRCRDRSPRSGWRRTGLCYRRVLLPGALSLTPLIA